MIDHIERFEEMAEYFADKGFVVAGNDHLGHGESVNSEDDYGYFAKGSHGADYLIKDMHRLTRIMKKMYKDIPYILIGHSMGSFMARKYACVYGDELDGVIFLGTGNQSKALVNTLLGLSYIARCAFTANGYIGFFNVIKYDINEKNIAKTPADLPVLFASGEEDPVGNYGKAVKKIFKLYTKYVDNVELRLYEDDRHELHSETNRQEVFDDLLEWIKSNVCSF